jgi:hypothetical protein
MRPGASMLAKIFATPGRTCSRPMASATTAGASTPFCVVTTAVSDPISDGSAVTRSGSCQVFTPSSTASTTPALAMSSVARTGSTVKSPSVLATLKPLARNASKCFPRATKVTSCPACARRPPK